MNTKTETSSNMKPDKFSLQEAFKLLLECRSRGELNKAVRDYIYPAFEDNFRHFIIKVSDTDPPPLLGASGLNSRDQELIRSYLDEDSLAKLLLLQNEVSEQVYLRDENQAQTLFPFMIFKIKSVVVEEEWIKSRAMVQGLLKSPSGIAIVNGDKDVVTCNQAFREIFDMTSGAELPHNLIKELGKEQANLEKPDPEETGKWGKEVSFFTLPKGTYKLYLIPLEAYDLSDKNLWLLRIHPAADPFTKSNRLIEKAGLTWREMEICCLIHDGLGRNEIAERLFISAHTVKTHLKKIQKNWMSIPGLNWSPISISMRTKLMVAVLSEPSKPVKNPFGLFVFSLILLNSKI